MSTLFAAFKNAFRQPAFLVAVLLLAVCAATLNSAAQFMQLHFKKLPAPLRVRSLAEGLPENLGNWVSISKDQAIDPEEEQVLATRQYVFRDYVDSRKVARAVINEMKNASVQERDRLLGECQLRNPASVLRVAVTYYTGLVDTVAHVPERCYVADGYEVSEYTEKPVALGNYPDGSPRNITYRFVAFEDQTGAGSGTQRVARNVGYIFHCNGKYQCQAIEVRRSLQSLLEPYGYYAKVELMTGTALPIGYQRGPNVANNRADSEAAMEDFMADALPQIEKCLPDWKALHRAK